MRRRSYRTIRNADTSRVPKFRISPTVFLIILSISIFVFTQLVYLSLFGTKGRDISELQLARDDVNQEIQQMQQKIANLNNIANIEKIAAHQLGMIKGSQVRYIDTENRVSSNLNLDK